MSRTCRSGNVYPNLSAELSRFSKTMSNFSDTDETDGEDKDMNVTSHRYVSDQSIYPFSNMSSGHDSNYSRRSRSDLWERPLSSDTYDSSLFDNSVSFSEILHNFYDWWIEQWNMFTNDPVLVLKNSPFKTKYLFAIVIFFVSFIFLHSASYRSETYETKERFRQISAVMKELVDNEKFLDKTQSIALNRVLHHAARSLAISELDVADRAPTVVLLVSRDIEQLKRLTNQLSTLMRQKTDVFVVQHSLSPDIDRLSLEKKILKELLNSSTQHRLLVLNNIDRLEGTAPLFLHSLADHENPPLKGLVILATLSLNSAQKTTNNAIKCDEKAFDYLTLKWTSQSLEKDKVLPVVSRLVSATVCF